MKVTRRMREHARLAHLAHLAGAAVADVDFRDDAAVLRWERERSARMVEALCRLAAEEGHAS